MVIFIKKV